MTSPGSPRPDDAQHVFTASTAPARSDDGFDVTCDALVVTAYPDALSPTALRVDAALDGLLTEMRTQHEHRGAFAEISVIPTLGRIPARRVLLLGLGDPAKIDNFRAHNAFHFAGMALRRRRLTAIVADIDTLLVTALGDEATAVRAAATGLLLANVDAVHSASGGPAPAIASVTISGAADTPANDAAMASAAVLADATNRTRYWTSLPGNRWTPTIFGKAVAELGHAAGLEVDVLDHAALESAGAGALLGVGSGSAEPPVMITMRWHGGGESTRTLGLVGKGITFDTGGISIKPAAGMELMKFDMGGGAAVVNAMLAIAAMNLPLNVVAVVPSAENMPGGSATKPGDVLRALDGQTIEVTNTDAEGRLILADGLVKAREMGATHLVDVATLTGAAIIAFGHVTAAMMSNNVAFAADVAAAADAAGDRVDPMPMHPEYDACLSSDVADLKNHAGKEAGSISAAVFLRAFVGDLPWTHLDVAGTAWNSQGSMTEIPKGASGAPVRTLVNLAAQFARS